MILIYTQVLLALLTFFVSGTNVPQQTLYSYTNGTAYVRLTNNDFFSIDFDQSFESTNTSGVIKTLDSPPVNSTMTLSDDRILAFYDNDGKIGVSDFDGSSWNEIEVNNKFAFYEYSTYMTTMDNEEKVYIYGGISATNDSDITSRILEYDINTNTFNDNISTSVSPTNFYGASNLLINYNTQLVIGGKSSSGWVGLKQLAMWQYESWSFKSIQDSDNINSRKYAQALPIFNQQDFAAEMRDTSSLSVDGAILLGGELINDYSVPKIIKLNITGSAGWTWSSLDDELDIDLDEILGSCVIYNTLMTFAEMDLSSTNTKRNGISSYKMSLFDVASDGVTLSAVDYSSTTGSATTASSSSSSSKSNKSTVIAVSVAVPIIVILLIVIGVIFYIKHKKSKDLTNNFESFDIMDFYNNLSKKNSVSYGHDEVKVNDYNDNDNLSINSWRRKRMEFERANKKKVPVQDLPMLPTKSEYNEEAVMPQRNESLIKRSLSNFSKTFSMKAKPSIRSHNRISEEMYDNNEKSRSTLQFIDENDANYKEMNDSRSTFSATTYYDESESPIKTSPYPNTNRFSDMTMLNNDSRVVFNDIDDDLYADNDIDVQVLVSSKRRSKLRVMNPDVDDEDDIETAKGGVEKIDENEEFMNGLFEMIDFDPDVTNDNINDGTRKRVVSGESSKEV